MDFRKGRKGCDPASFFNGHICVCNGKGGEGKGGDELLVSRACSTGRYFPVKGCE